MAVWHPDATRVPYLDVGPFTVGNPKLVWHSTEGLSLPRYSGSAPHFTFDPLNGKLWQHIAVNRAALSLLHPAGTVETNKAHAIQVEMIAFSDEAAARRLAHPDRAVVNFTPAVYQRIAGLARWIEANASVPRTCGVKFVRYPAAVYPRLAPADWLRYTGHCGHQHVPSNYHGDPSLLDMTQVLAGGAQPAEVNPYPGSPLRAGSAGAAVRLVQDWLNRVGSQAQQIVVDGTYGPATARRVTTFQRNHKLTADGVVGRQTWTALRAAATHK